MFLFVCLFSCKNTEHIQNTIHFPTAIALLSYSLNRLNWKTCRGYLKQSQELYDFRINGGSQPVTPMKDDSHSSIFFPDIIRAMMNERGHWTGSIFKPQMPEPDSLQGQRLHRGVPFFYLLKTERHSPLANLRCQGFMKK